jgi:[ribosomal protein S5]-alanine N-acetyltransferase
VESTDGRHHVVIDTERLRIRPWHGTDASAALTIYGDPDVVRWLRPFMDPVHDTATMRIVIDRWTSNDRSAADAGKPVGHWAVERRSDGVVVGGVSLQYVPPDDADLEVGWHLARNAWGSGYASEAGDAVVRWALHDGDALEVFALVGSRNDRAASTATRVGMELVGETDLYGDVPLQVYRLRHADLGLAGPGDEWVQPLSASGLAASRPGETR